MFDLVLRDRIRFRPVERKDGPGYELTVPIAFDRLVVSVIPTLQVRVASPMPASWNQDSRDWGFWLGLYGDWFPPPSEVERLLVCVDGRST